LHNWYLLDNDKIYAEYTIKVKVLNLLVSIMHQWYKDVNIGLTYWYLLCNSYELLSSFTSFNRQCIILTIILIHLMVKVYHSTIKG